MSGRQVIGVDPDMSEAAFIRVLKEAKSPALSSAHAVYQECVKRRVSPAFLLALFQHESGFGLKGWATITLSWGNTRPPSFGATPKGVFDQDSAILWYVWDAPRPPGRRYLCAYRDWIDGGVSTVARFVEHAAYRGKTTVEQIIPVWAPSSDGNDTARYIASVLASMDQWAAVAPRVNPLSPQEAHMVNKPPINTSHPSPNRNGYGGTRRADAIVWHVTVGGLAGTLSWLTSPASAASANYVIGKDGTIYELVPPDQDAWANGVVKSPDLSNPVIAGWLAENVNFNQRTISVEHERLTSANEQPGGFTEAQHQATVRLAAWLCQEFGIPPDRQHIIRHGQIDSVNRAHCPGLAESEMVAWIGEIAALVNAPPVLPENKPPVPNLPGAKSAGGGTGWYLNERGELVVWANFGGVNTEVLGVNYADLGGSTRNAKGETWDRSIIGNEWQPWVKRP